MLHKNYFFRSLKLSGKRRKQGWREGKGTRMGWWEGKETSRKRMKRKGKCVAGFYPTEGAYVVSQDQSVYQSVPLWWTVPWTLGFNQLLASLLILPRKSLADKWFCLLICLFEQSQICYIRVVNISVIIFINRYITMCIIVVDRIVLCILNIASAWRFWYVLYFFVWKEDIYLSK